jgi:hypothetical protein
MKKNLLILASLLFMTALCAFSFMGVSQSNIKSINGVAIANIGKIGVVEISGSAETVADPVFDPISGSHSTNGSLTYSIACETEGATIYYEQTSCLLGPEPPPEPPDPTSSSNEYTGAITIYGNLPASSYIIRAIAIKAGENDSNIIRCTYDVMDLF